MNAGTSLGAGGLAAGAVGVALRRTREALGERQVALAALTAAFVFAAQMVSFPVAAGTSGHLMGGVLAGVLVGPWTGLLCVTVVLGVQALLFADGGISALGLNIVNLGVVAGLGGYVGFLALRRLLRPLRAPLHVCAGVAAGLSLPLAAAAFTLELAIGGNVDVPLTEVALAAVGTHALIGIGEGVITALALAAVLAARPDLVHAVDQPAAPLELRPAAPAPAGR